MELLGDRNSASKSDTSSTKRQEEFLRSSVSEMVRSGYAEMLSSGVDFAHIYAISENGSWIKMIICMRPSHSISLVL